MAIEKFVELEHFQLDKTSIQKLPYDYCSKKRIVILNIVDDHSTEAITLGVIDDSDSVLLEEVQKLLGRPISPVRLNAYEIQKAIDIGYDVYQKEDTSDYTLTLNNISSISYDPDTPMSKVVNEILGRAISLKASDIHIESYPDDVDVRFRIDGILHQINHPLSKGNIRAAISRLRVLANLDVTEQKHAQDGRINSVFQEDGDKRVIDFRLSIIPGPFGFDAVLRILDSSQAIVGLDKLGFSEANMNDFQNLISSPEGLVLVAGPTGSGKTTTLYSALHYINTPQNKVLTVEDPVEYIFPKTNQKQINASMGFADYVRAFMRQNPDIIMIGEIRDEETAEVAFRAAQTGHLVFSTIHAIDSVRGVSRLRTLGVDSSIVATCLLGIVSQRLVRKLCLNCRKPYTTTEQDIEKFNFPKAMEFFTAGEGCSNCRNIGYKSRTGIYELFAISDEVAEMITKDIAIQEIREYAIKKGMKTLLDDAMMKAITGTTCLNEISRVIPYRIITEQSKKTSDI